ncbi:RNA polymerase II-associated protein isoform 1 [Schistosoma japonicum]|uniref:RNA polymerase II-associated protein 3 n=1 Tax=Schistosoma japonicum TaxID=6182 RepID=A0A4Z2D8H2_SCHJA|nr:RNA polymerase II-associated protein isoform 1 [Schistosoma japonicum]
MDPEKFLSLQMQMRENNMEVEGFLKDFDAWKQRVESKSQHLGNSSQPELPAVRNSLLKKHKKKAAKQAINDKNTGRIKADDYRAWDKFANQALEDDDDNGFDPDKISVPQNDRDCSSETDEEQEDRRRIELSKEARELGNIRFKEGKLNEAIEHYTMAIRLAPEDSTSYTNRALTYIKTERYASAEADCTAALKLDRTSVKAFYRRALARKGLGHTSGAIEDLKELLKYNPDNKTALNELEALIGRKEVSTPKSSMSCSSSFQSRNPRKMRRIPIIEVGSNDHNKLMKTCTQNITKSDCNNIYVQNKNNPIIKKDEFQKNNALHSTLEASTILSASRKISSPDKEVSTGNTTITCINDPINKHEPLRNINLRKPPSNWFQLERELRELCQRSTSSHNYLSKEAITYLCNIQPTDYDKLFGENMDSDFLSRMIQAFSQSDQLTNQQIADRLIFLSKLPRFDIAWMMTSESERVSMIKFIKTLQNDNSISKEALRQICVQFECE